MSSLIKKFKENKLIKSSNIYDNGRLLDKVLENYNRIINQLPTVDGEGESITLNGCINAEFVKFRVKGNTYQNGEPSPSNEIPIQNTIGDNSIIVANSDNSISKTLNFMLAQGQKMFEGDYLADDGIHQLWGEVTLDGVNNKVSKNDSNVNSYLYLFAVSHEKIAGYCNRFIHANEAYPSQSNKEGMFNSDRSVSAIYFNGHGIVSADNLQLADANEFNTWLQTHNVKVQYKLKTPVIIPYTELQHQQYEAIKRALSHAGITNITQVNDDLPFNLEVSALKDLHTLEYLNELNN